MKSLLFTFLKKIKLYNYFRLIKDKYFLAESDKRMNILRTKFYSKIISNNELVFDIGANKGEVTEIFLTLGAKVVSFEPQPELANYLRFKFRKKIYVEEVALGSSPDKCEIFLSSADKLASLSSDWIESVKNSRFSHVTWNDKIEVNVTTLDLMISKYGIPAFCKIDVEGFELEVLKGLSRKVKMLSFEFHVPEQIQKAIDCLNYLNGLGIMSCNYTIGDSMTFKSEKWFTYAEMKTIISEMHLQNISGGDIYINFIDAN